MVFLILLVIVSLIGVVASLALPEWSDLLLIAGPCALAGICLLLFKWGRRARNARKAKREWVVLDGSNVMHWKDGTPQIETVREVLSYLSKRGYTLGVVFDANAGYLISGTYLHDSSFGKMLGLPEERVMVVPKGTPADPYILDVARDLGARVVSNDRFRDWSDDHPELREPGFLVRGGFRSGHLWLELEMNTTTTMQ